MEEKKIKRRKFLLFVFFWTLFLGPLEYWVLHLPLAWMVFVRILAIPSNYVWDKWWYNNPKLWKAKKKPLPIFRKVWLQSKLKEVPRMGFMKLFVNVTNFVFLLVLTYGIRRSGFDPGIKFSAIGFATKVSIVVGFAIMIAIPYAGLEEWIFPIPADEHSPLDELSRRVEGAHDDVHLSASPGFAIDENQSGAGIPTPSHRGEIPDPSMA